MIGSLDKTTIDQIVRRVVEVARPDRIILFGSAAAEEMTQDSDVDLLVLKTSPNPREESLRIRDALGDVALPFDIIVISTERFEETKGVVGGIAYPADRYGRVIYEAA